MDAKRLTARSSCRAFPSRIAIAGVVLAVLLNWVAPAMGQGVSRTGVVYVMTNQPAGNTIVRFARSGNGSLARIDETATGGLGGTGNGIGIFDPLGSADSLIQND